MRLKDALTRAVAKLATANVPSPRLNAETLLLFTLSCDRAYLYAHAEQELTADELTRFDEALAQRARVDAARLQLSDRIHFYQSDLLSDIPQELQFDLIVSNPPYVAERDAESVEAQVRKFEPHHAVFARETGMEVYRRLIPPARERLVAGGWLVMEIGAGM